MRKWIYVLVSAILLFNTSTIQGISSTNDSRVEWMYETTLPYDSQEVQERNTLFEDYPWLANLVDQNNCGSAKIEVYQGGAFTYLLVTDDQRVVKLYNDQGQFYCQGGPGYDCVALYNLDGPTDTWECPPAVTDCNTEIIINQLKGSGGANACYAVTRINQVDYNGKSYFRTHVGRTIASFIQDNPCGPRDNFGATYDCQGLKICDFAAPIPPPNFDPVICAALTNQPDRIVWEDEANTCRIGNPLTLPFIADIINNTGGEACERVTNITQIVYEGFTFFRINSETVISTAICIALAPTDVILDCKGNRIGTVGGRNDCPPGSACAELAASTGNTIWSREANNTQCYINISSKFCRKIGIYDINDNLLHTLDPGQVPAITIPFEEWQDPNPLTEGETRTYIYKEGLFELGRGTASCDNPNIEVTSRFNSGCSDAAGVLILTNIGCRDLNIFGTSGNLLSTIIPDGSGNFGPEPKTLYILIAGTDTLGVLNVAGFSELDIDTKGCSDGGNNNEAIFNDYPWLSDLVNANNCSNEEVAVYQQGIYFYLLVSDANGNSNLYNQDGQFYCQNAPNYDCVSAYRLGTPIDNWNCSGGSSGDCLSEEQLIGMARSVRIFDPCLGVTKVTKIEYNGNDYYRTFIGAVPSIPAIGAPCFVQENFGQIIDCQGRIVCLFSLEAPPADYDPALCNAVQSLTGVEVWTNPALTTGSCSFAELIRLNPCDPLISETALYEYNGTNYIVTIPDPSLIDAGPNVINCSDGSNFCTISPFFDSPLCNDFFRNATKLEVLASREDCSTCTGISVAGGLREIVITNLSTAASPLEAVAFSSIQYINKTTNEGGFASACSNTCTIQPGTFLSIPIEFESGNNEFEVFVTFINGLTCSYDVSVVEIEDCICTADYNPVCGVDGKTYSNACGAACAGVEIASIGECGQGNNPAIFDDYPWLSDIVDPNNCNIDGISVYQQGIYAYLLVADQEGGATLYNQDGLFYCQNAPNYDCVAAYNLTGNLIDSWICNPEPNCPQVIVCGVDGNIYPTPCAAAEAGVEATTDLGPCHQNMDCNFNYEGIVTVSLCGGQSDDPILQLEDGRYIAAAFSGSANFTGQAGDRLRVRMDIDIQEEQGVNCSVPAIIGLIRCFEIIDTADCPEDDCSLTTLPSDIGLFTVIYSICEGDTLTVPNTFRSLICNNAAGPAPPIGTPIPVDIIPQVITTTPRWESNGSNDFSSAGSTISFYPKETTEFIGYLPPSTCTTGAPISIGAPLYYLVIVNKGSNCQTTESPTFLIEACIGDIITIPSPVVPSANSINACTGNRQFTGGTTAELAEPISPFKKDIQVRILQQGSFQIEAMGGSGNYSSVNDRISCPDLTYQFQVRLKPECSFACAAVYDPVCGVDGQTYGNACEALRAGVTVAAQGECTSNNDDAIFTEFPWLRDFVNPTSCNGESITVYQLGTFKYIYLEGVFDNTLFFQDGQTYCVDAPNYDCRAAYRLSEIVRRWTCDGNSNEVPNCANYTGTIFFRNCDDNRQFYFIETEDGRIFDPYFPADISYTPLEGQKVNFDFTDADFSSPCSIAEKAINITCIETAENPSNNGDCTQHNGTIFFENCDDGTEFFFARTSTGLVLDLYFAEGINFAKYPGQQVNFDYIVADFNSPCSIADQAVIVTCIEEAIDNSNPAIFDNFPWLSTLLDPNSCEGRVTVYQSNSFQFVYIDTPKGNNLYFQDGTFYCQDSPSYDCRAAYKLTEVVDSWTCSNYQEPINEKRSIRTIEKIDLSLFPNPTTGQVTVKVLTNIEQAQQLRVVDLFGRVLSQEIIESNVRQVRVDLSTYKNGVYYLELRARGNRVLKKVVKQDLE